MVQAIKKLASKKVTLLLMTPLIAFAMLAAPAGSLGSVAGTQKASAAYRGDWTQQYWTTYSYAKSHYYCPAGGCTISYFGSYDMLNQPNSREFIWVFRYANGQVYYQHSYIGSNNHVWHAFFYRA